MDIIQINLLPEEFKKNQSDFSWIHSRQVIWPTIIFLSVIVLGLAHWMTLQAKVDELNNQIQIKKREIEAQKPLLDKIDVIKKNIAEIERKNDALKSIQVSKQRWIIIFENLSAILPPNTWFNSFQQKTENTIELEGVTYQFSEVSQYMQELKKQTSVENVSLVRIKTITVNGNPAFEFNLLLDMNPRIGLDGESPEKLLEDLDENQEKKGK